MKERIFCDTTLCTGCGACVVACMDEHDTDLSVGELPHRHIKNTEELTAQGVSIVYASLSCHHCTNSPCVANCPTGALTYDDAIRGVVVNHDLCVGCRRCATACPYDVPKYDGQGKISKCNLCASRLHAGLPPACVRVCPVSALMLQG